MIVADALGQVRAARVFADDSRRRTALAELEVMLVEVIEAESDSTVRAAAWHYVETSSDGTAEKIRLHVERTTRDMLDRYQLTKSQHDHVLQERLTSHYRTYLENTVELVSPASVGGRYPTLNSSKERCASRSWRRLHAAALRAAAL